MGVLLGGLYSFLVILDRIVDGSFLIQRILKTAYSPAVGLVSPTKAGQYSSFSTE